jgi:hypothetical protein
VASFTGDLHPVPRVAVSSIQTRTPNENRSQKRGHQPGWTTVLSQGGNPSPGTAEDRRKRLDLAAKGGLLPQITPVNGLAKQGFSATGKWFYRIEVFFEILHRKIIDSNNLL